MVFKMRRKRLLCNRATHLISKMMITTKKTEASLFVFVFVFIINFCI